MIDEWKELFGVGDKYDKVYEFKRWVLEPAIEQINEQGEFELTLEQQKSRANNHPFFNQD